MPPTVFRRSAELGAWQAYYAPGSAQRSTPVVHITAALSVDLVLLTEALDRPGTDIVDTLHQFAADARLAVRSYLGMSLITAGGVPFTFTALEKHVSAGDVRSSLLMPLAVGGAEDAAPGPALILYGARAGAFVDLAADVSWLTGVDLCEYALDQHLDTIALPPTEPTVQMTSVINQAIGVLIGRGYVSDEAQEKLSAQALDAGTDRYNAAVHILSTLVTDADATLDPR